MKEGNTIRKLSKPCVGLVWQMSARHLHVHIVFLFYSLVRRIGCWSVFRTHSCTPPSYSQPLKSPLTLEGWTLYRNWSSLCVPSFSLSALYYPIESNTETKWMMMLTTHYSVTVKVTCGSNIIPCILITFQDQTQFPKSLYRIGMAGSQQETWFTWQGNEKSRWKTISHKRVWLICVYCIDSLSGNMSKSLNWRCSW